MSPPSLHRALLSQAELAPDRRIYRYIEASGAEIGSLTCAELVRRSAALAGALQARGEPVMLCTGPGMEQAVGLFGLWAAGAVAVPVYPPGPEGIDGLARVARASGARALVAPSALLEGLMPALAERLGAAAPAPIPLEAEGPPGVQSSAETALILYTSGSTGDPKGVLIRHDAFLGNMAALASVTPNGALDTVGTWLPHAHIAGLYTRLLGVGGSEVVVLPPAAFSRQPMSWLQMLTRHRCSFSAAPDFAYALCAAIATDSEVAGLDLSAWQMAVCGGEKVRKTTMDAFFARFGPAGARREALRPYYGMTETLCNAIPRGRGPTTLVASQRALRFRRLRAPEDAADAVALLSNGPPLGDAVVLTVSPETGFPCAPGQVGELWTAGPSNTAGYHREEALTAEVTRAHLADGSGPYLRTGDLGLVHEGEVYVTGRLKELLIVRGKNHHPTDIEATAASRLGELSACAAFSVSHDGDEALGLAVEVRHPDPDALVRALRRAVASGHGLAIARLYLLPPGTLPRTPTQKISRAQCREAAESGAWDAYAAETARQQTAPAQQPAPFAELSGEALQEALLARMGALLVEIGGAKVGLDQPIAELGLGSIELAHMAARLRAILGFEPPLEAIYDGTSPRALVARVVEGQARAALSRWREPVYRVVDQLPCRLPPQREVGGVVLLTGATGFLGSYLAASLLAQGCAELRCLVRAADPDAAMQRVESALRAGPGWDPAWRARLRPLCGDVSAPRLGLDPAAWQAQVEEVDQIVHNAANVNFVAPYAMLQRSNVDPAQELVRLATSEACRPVHLVSTLAVFNATYRREQRRVRGIDRLQKPDHIYSGYAQSKFVCEAAFRAAGSRGMRLGVHRPGLIVGAWQSGHSNPDDFLSRFIRGCVELGVYPQCDVELDLVAVDDVAAGIAAATLEPVRDIDTFHWTNPRPVPVSALMQVFTDRGHRMEPEPLQAWLHRVRAALPRENALYPVHPFLLEIPPGSRETILEFMDGLPLDVDAAEADALRIKHDLPRRDVDTAALHRLAARMEQDALLPSR